MPMTLAIVDGAVMFLVWGGRLLAGASTPSDGFRVGAHAFAVTLCGLFAFQFNDLYDLRRVRRFGQFVGRFPQALLMTLVLAGLVEWIVQGVASGARSLGETVLIIGVAVLPPRAILHHLCAAHPFSRRVLVLGTTELAGKIVREMLAEPDLRDVVVGVAGEGADDVKPELPSLWLGNLENLGRIIEGFEPDLIVCAAAEHSDPVLLRELLKARSCGVRVEDGLDAYERLTGKIPIESATPRAILFSGQSGVSWIALSLARALSFLVACVGLVLLGPLLLPVALLIKADSEGPIFFLHERVGLGGRPFNLIKFRTMRIGEAKSEWAADNQDRTTRVGYWLRRFRIDELPQFLNIVRGEMNLVGPRPHPTSNVALFTENIPYYGVRCSVRPGVTGWAQIRYGYANNLEEETEKMRYDLHYIRHLSLGLDLRILFETVKVVLTGGRPATLAEGSRARPRPIYFGIEHPKRSRMALAPSRGTAGGDGRSVSGQHTRGPRESRGVA